MNFMLFSLVWSDTSLLNVTSKQTLKYILFTKKATRTAITGHRQHTRTSRSHRAAAMPSAAVVHSDLHVRECCSSQRTAIFFRGYNGTFPSAGSWFLGQQAALLWLAIMLLNGDRRPPLTSSAFNLTVDVFAFCVLLCIGPQLDCASRYPLCV
jgi:hypothetical protein